MAFHVPFSQRPSGGQSTPSQPIYIGFESPRRRRREFNWWGFNGIFLFFLSLGALAPITFLISLMGLRKKPRGMAIAGTGLSLVGMAVMAAVVISAVHHAKHKEFKRHMARQNRVIAKQVEEGHAILAYAASEFEQFRDDHDGQLPADLDGNALALKHLDPWENEIMYEIDSKSAGLRSAGPDGEFFSRDDLTYRINGTTHQEVLLPIEKGEVAE